MKEHRYIFPLLILFFLAQLSCKDDLGFENYQYRSKLVVDGWIENGQHSVVVLTKSMAYFSKVDSATLREMVATKAKVTVSDGEKEEILTLKRNTAYYPPYIYQGTEIKGEVGKTYYLKVEYENLTYHATTTIPPPKKFDSLWFQLAPGHDSLGYIYAKLHDNKETEDYYRIFTKRNSKDNKFIPIYLSAIGDQFFNGQSFTFSLLRGSESMADTRDDIYFRKGDTVRVKLTTIDRTHFDFWRTLERELYVTGNPFASSGNEIKSNISGGALGVWGGYSATIFQVIARVD